MSSMLKDYAGKVDLIYSDPPFETGADFSIEVRVGDTDLTKEPSILEEHAYRDTPVDQLPTRPRASTSSPVSRAEIPEPEKAGLPLIVRDEDILDRLTFDPKAITYYRKRFAKGMGLQRAEAKLRAELGQAEQKRKHPGQYLTFIVPGKFEVSLTKRPISEEPDTCYVRGITVLNRAKKRKAA